MMGIRTVRADFNDLDNIRTVLTKHPEIKAALVQYTRQSMEDSYEMESVIQTIKSCREIPVITDDNYAVMKVEKMGSQCGADVSCFSAFKLLGPEGIGCVVGKRAVIDKIVKMHYSGGSQTQGHEALDVLRGMVYAPVALAIQAQVNEECVQRPVSYTHLMRVAYDKESLDQSQITKSVVGKRKVELINIRTQQTVNALQDGVIDAGVWNYDDILENHYLDNLKVVFLQKEEYEESFSAAVLVVKKNSRYLQQILEKNISVKETLKIQDEVRRGKRRSIC